MHTRNSFRLKNLTLVLCALTLSVAGSTALAADHGGRVSRVQSYTEFDYQDSASLLDAINRDHPRSSVSGNYSSPYVQYGHENTAELLAALDRDRSVGYAPYNGTNGTRSPYMMYDEDDSVALLDAINRDAAMASAAPRYQAPAVVWQSGAVISSAPVEITSVPAEGYALGASGVETATEL